MHSKYIKIYQQTTKSSSKYCVTFTQDERKEQWHIFTAVNWTVAQAGPVVGVCTSTGMFLYRIMMYTPATLLGTPVQLLILTTM